MKTTVLSVLLAALACSSTPPETQMVVLQDGHVVTMRKGFTIDPGEPVMVCCKVDGTDCYPVDHATDCPGGRFVSECACPSTLPDGSTDCRC